MTRAASHGDGPDAKGSGPSQGSGRAAPDQVLATLKRTGPLEHWSLVPSAKP
jgi:hypothetical protein